MESSWTPSSTGRTRQRHRAARQPRRAEPREAGARLATGCRSARSRRGTGRASCAHLLALDERDRYLRFGYAASDAQIARYVDTARLRARRGLRHLQPPPRTDRHGPPGLPGARRDRRGRRPSSASRCCQGGARPRLSATACSTTRCCTRATAASTRLLVHALSENTAMLRIARNAGARIERDGPESQAWVKLAPGDPGVARRRAGRGTRAPIWTTG